MAAAGLLVCVLLFVSLFAGWEGWWGCLWLAFWGVIFLEAALGVVERRRQRRRL
ncbi:MAG: hypothetical protein JWO79_4342 [Actinomycetia bacterium]|nr:hypothetical protein [Actinomycetes bacterium]